MREQMFYSLYVHMFGSDVRKGREMRTTAMLVSGLVGLSLLLVVALLALGFGIGVTQAVSQAWPLAVAGALVAGFMVELDRRASW